MAIDRCACCGAYMQEGRQVCASCEQRSYETHQDKEVYNYKLIRQRSL